LGTGPALGSDHNGYIHYAPVHVPPFCDVIDDLIHRDGRHVHVHDFYAWTQAAESRSKSQARYGRLRNRRLLNAPRPEVLQ